MSEANTIYNMAGTIIATAKLGVAWPRNPHERLGEYDDGESGTVFDNQRKVAGSFNAAGDVLNAEGKWVGQVSGTTYDLRLYAGASEVGRCIGNRGAGAAAVLFLFT